MCCLLVPLVVVSALSTVYGNSQAGVAIAKAAAPWLKELGRRAAEAAFAGAIEGTASAIVHEMLVTDKANAQPVSPPPKQPPQVTGPPPSISFTKNQTLEEILKSAPPLKALPVEATAARPPSVDQLLRDFRLPSQATRPAAPSGSQPQIELHPVEAFRRGYAAEFGSGRSRNPVEAEQFYRQAARQGHVFAQYSLAQLYHFGDTGVSRNDTESLRWLRAAAERGLPAAQTQLAYAYDVGEGVPPDARAAAFWYSHAAQQGDPYAQYAMAQIYYFGGVVPPNRLLEFDWLNLAVDQGHPPALAAMHWMLDAEYDEARRGNPGAQYFFGRAYEIGVRALLPQDYVAAASWYDIAARNGNRNAQLALNRLCDTGSIRCW